MYCNQIAIFLLLVFTAEGGGGDFFHEVVEGAEYCVGGWQEGTDFSVIVT